MNPYTLFDVSVLEAVEKQATLDGWIYLGLAVLFLIGLFIGIYLLRSFLKSLNKEQDKWLLHTGAIVITLCGIFFVIFIWMALGRLLNPSYYAVEYLKGMLRIQRQLRLPF